MTTENTTLATTEKAESLSKLEIVIKRKSDDKEIVIRPEFFLADIKSGKTFISKKEFKDSLDLGASEAKRAYDLCRDKIAKVWTIANKAKDELDGWQLKKLGKVRTLADGSKVRNSIQFIPADKVKEEPKVKTMAEMSLEEIEAGLGDKAKALFERMAAKMAGEQSDADAIEV